MATENEVLTASSYIKHHLQNLTYGKHPDGTWGIAHGVEEAREMGFWAIHLDTMFFSVRSRFIVHHHISNGSQTGDCRGAGWIAKLR